MYTTVLYITSAKYILIFTIYTFNISYKVKLAAKVLYLFRIVKHKICGRVLANIL